VAATSKEATTAFEIHLETLDINSTAILRFTKLD